MNDERLDLMVHRQLDGGLTPEEAAELDALILSSSAARARFWELARFHGLVREWGAGKWGKEVAVAESGAVASRKIVPLPWLRPALAWAAALVLGFAAWWFARHSPAEKSGAPNVASIESRDELDEPAEIESGAPLSTPRPAPAAAVLTRMADVQWSTGQPARTPGAVLAPGWLKLERGVVQIEFYSGAHVILEGPAEFEIVSDFEARCRFGRFSANVPEQAHGFKVVTPGVTVLDLGTAFACNVPRTGLPDVHVLEGRVSLWTEKVVGSEWTKGQAVRERDGRFEPIAFQPERFVTPQQLAQQADTAAQRRYAAWKQTVRALDGDPTTLVHYTFEDQEEWDGVLANRAAQAHPVTHGGIVGAAWSEGRWPGKGALEFKGASDRVRLGVPGEHRALTYLAWVRTDGLPNASNSLLAAVQSGLGAADWDLTNDGGLSFRVRAARGQVPVYFYGGVSANVATPLHRGQWLHLATVYDVNAGSITHYVDGQPAGTLLPKKVVPATLDELELGNWALSPAARKFWPAERPIPRRNFVGRIDELAIVARAMSREEIASHYEVGRP